MKDEFGLKEGLADTTKTKVKVKVPTHDKRHKGGMVEEEREVHKVQILDPAAGTGTFLAEVIKQIHSKFEGQQGIWATYVEEHLIPRLNGFEILMASYAMAHLKLDLLLRETGVEPSGSERFRVYLTNSLEEHHPDTGTLFAGWLSEEANEANHIKRDTPVMVVLGNPPYSVSSRNNGEWIEERIKTYKEGVQGYNKNALSDDYVKFIRYGQYLIEKNSEGILAYISNNSFIDGITHHKMREDLLNAFDKIYVLDLHGSYKKQEVTDNGEKDENVFDIQQGVSINIFIKKKESHNMASLLKNDALGKRKEKYNYLTDNSLSTINWKAVEPQSPDYFFKEFKYKLRDQFEEWISLDKLFIESGTGIKFRKDNLLIKPHFDRDSVIELFKDMKNLNSQQILEKYNISDTKDWKISEKRDLFEDETDDIMEVQYRLFDSRFTYYPYEKIHEIIVRGDSRRELMRNLFFEDNLALLSARQQSAYDFQHVFIGPSRGFKTLHFQCSTLVFRKNLKDGIMGLWKKECEEAAIR